MSRSPARGWPPEAATLGPRDMHNPPPSRDAASLGTLLCAAAGGLGVLALLADPACVARHHFRLPLSSEALEETARSRTLFALAALGLLALGWRLRARARPLAPATARVLLALATLVLPLFALERGARPFVERLTTLFQTDPVLGWRNRPGVTDTFWGEPARINAQGLRGPERARPKPPGLRRVLVLGDSVAFGLGLAEDRDTFPARLERALAARGAASECLNAGVCGWSTRQERLFLEREGEGWQPDLVLVAFVLNDVTERPGGTAQLAYTRPEGMPGWLANSGLYLALHELALRRALAGDSPEARAHQARLTPYHLILQPGSEGVEAAWRALWPELEGLQAWCVARSLPVVLVAFPHAFQLRDPGTDRPQRFLADHAARRDMAFLDLLPPFGAALRARGLALEDLFHDGVHPSASGNELAADETARFLIEHALLP